MISNKFLNDVLPILIYSNKTFNSRRKKIISQISVFIDSHIVNIFYVFKDFLKSCTLEAFRFDHCHSRVGHIISALVQHTAFGVGNFNLVSMHVRIMVFSQYVIDVCSATLKMNVFTLDLNEIIQIKNFCNTIRSIQYSGQASHLLLE